MLKHFLVLVLTSLPALALAQSSAPVACEDLAGQDLTALPEAPTRITSATIVAAIDDTPEYCAVTGYVAPQIQFEVRLPTDGWNGNYFQTGCGGFCGVIPIESCAPALARNYAVAAENSGHTGANAFDALWAYGDRQAEIDFAHRSPYAVSVAAKELIRLFYGQPAEHAYFQGCSTGGRQALMMAQRYPEAFDGIVAGSPALLQNYLATIAQGYLERVNRDAQGQLILPVDKLSLLSDAVMAACDETDGRADGVIDDPMSCSFEPATLECAAGQDPATCLTSPQVAVVEAFYAGAPDENGDPLFAGLARGSELGWGLFNFSIGTDERMSGSGIYATQVLRYLAFDEDPGPSYSLDDFDYGDPAARAELEPMARLYNSDDPDMTTFRDRGGKLILYHGFADPLITPIETINYYTEAAELGGGIDATQEWFRLFMLPGVYHCRGGPGSDQVDWLTAIEQWVEQDTSPGRIVARKIEDGAVAQERILLPYPALPVSE